MKTTIIASLVLASQLFLACGKQNLFRKAEDPDPLEEAATLLEQNKVDDAIQVLKDELEENPGNTQAMSLLSTAIAQKWGIDTITMALKLADSQQNAESQLAANEVVRLYAILPPATDEVINGVTEAQGWLQAIPQEARTKSDFFRLSLLNLTAMVLHTKQFDLNGNGQLETAELASMTTADASAIIQILIGAQTNAAIGAAAEGENAAKVAEAMAGIKSKIDQAEGATTEEKLKNYLASTGQTLPSSVP